MYPDNTHASLYARLMNPVSGKRARLTTDRRKAIGVRIKSLRKAAGISAETLAEKCGLSSVKMIENGSRGSMSSYMKIAESLDVELIDLLGDEPRKITPELQAFLDSPLANDVTADEAISLTRLPCLAGRSHTLESYHLGLLSLRASAKAKK